MNTLEIVSETLRMRTLVGHNAVYYAVETGERGEWVTVWSTTVKFGMRKANRAGSYAFKTAAHLQEKAARL